MSMTLKSAASALLGVPPMFRRARTKPGKAKPVRVEPAIAPVAFAPVANDSGVDVDKLLAATRKAPVDLSIIEWDGDSSLPEEIAVAIAPADGANDDMPAGYDTRSRRIRDRYIGARFPGVARSSADLESPARVVKSARLFFEDGQVDTALELLDLAIEQDSRAEALWLAQLEILFLGRNAPRFVETARAFRAMHRTSESWDEVARLGRALAPTEGLFGASSGPRDHDHYGPWPDLPNWIQANWDLTAEVVAADFHRILKQRSQKSRAATKLAA